MSGPDLGALLRACHRRLVAATERLAPLGLDGELADLREAAVGRELRLVVVGRFKSGKSSVVNALSGAPVSPVDVLPCTTRAIEVRHGAATPMAWLGPDVVLVDTPGTDEDAARTAIADEELARADAALLVVRATQVAALSELDLIDQLERLGGRRAAVLAVINRSDEIDEQGRVDVLRFARARLASLGVAPERVVLFSALYPVGVEALRAAVASLVRAEVPGLRLAALYRRVELVTTDLAPRLAAIAGPQREQARAAEGALAALRNTFQGGV